MELREYFDVIWKWGWIIALGTLLTAGTAAVVSFTMSPVYEAKAGVAIVKSGFSVAFEPKIKTLDDVADVSRYPADTEARRIALAALVENGAIATQVIEELGDDLDPEERSAIALLEMVSGEIAGGGRAQADMIAITVRASGAGKAMKIANAWGEAYEKYVNQIYGGGALGSQDTIRTQTNAAKAAYEKAEEALIQFTADNQIDDLNRQIEEKRQIIASLQSGKQTAMTTVIDTELQARSNIIAEYINTQANNRLIAFQKEQAGKSALLAKYMDAEINNRLTAIQKDYEARSKLFAEYVDAEISNRLTAFRKEQEAKLALFSAYADADRTVKIAVFKEQVDARVQTLADYYATKLRVQRLLGDAQALRNQISQGGATNSSATGGLAIMLLKAEAFASSVGLPGDLQISLDVTTGLDASPEEQVRDLDALIKVLEGRLSELESAIEEQSLQLFNNEGYKLLSASRPEDDPLFEAIRQKYAELFEVGALAEDAITTPLESELSQAILARYDELFGVGNLGRAAESTTSSTPLFVSIKKKYPELFAMGDFIALTEAVPPDNPLAIAATQKSQALLQLKDLEDLPAYSAAAESLTSAIERLEQEADQLRAQLEQETARKQELTRARDLAWETYSTLARKVTEVDIASAVTGTEVRFAMPAIEPRWPVAPRRKLIVMLASALGLALSVGLAFLFDYLRVQPTQMFSSFRLRGSGH